MKISKKQHKCDIKRKITIILINISIKMNENVDIKLFNLDQNRINWKTYVAGMLLSGKRNRHKWKSCGQVCWQAD